MVIKPIKLGMKVETDPKTGRITGVFYNRFIFKPKNHFKQGTKFIALKFRKPGTKTIFVRPKAKR